MPEYFFQRAAKMTPEQLGQEAARREKGQTLNPFPYQSEAAARWLDSYTNERKAMSQTKRNVYQEKILEAVRGDSRSLIITARAGTGKTTTLVQVAEALNPSERTLALAFNRSIANELKTRLPPHVTAMTSNALGHQALRRFIPRRLQSPDTRKLFKLSDELEIEDYSHRLDVVRLTRAARIQGMGPSQVPSTIPRPSYRVVSDTEEEWRAIGEIFDISVTPEMIEDARTLLTLCAREAFRGVIDFDDQLWLPVLWGASLGRYDTVLIDEAQDLSPLQHLQIQRINPDRIIAFGDPNQAIYGFRGAYPDSMERLLSQFAALEMPLLRTYRCGKAIIREAQRIVPDIEADEGNPEGVVSDRTDGPQFGPSDLRGHDVVLCRYNAPIIELAWNAIRKGIPVQVAGQRLEEDLVNVINKITRGKIQTVKAFIPKLETWYERAITDSVKRGEKVKDQYEVLSILSESCNTTGCIQSAINQIFRQKGGTVLSSIHKSKGLEWNRVAILNPELIPSEYAKKNWQKAQEKNLMYVAMTRARYALTYVHRPRRNKDV